MPSTSGLRTATRSIDGRATRAVVFGVALDGVDQRVRERLRAPRLTVEARGLALDELGLVAVYGFTLRGRRDLHGNGGHRDHGQRDDGQDLYQEAGAQRADPRKREPSHTSYIGVCARLLDRRGELLCRPDARRQELVCRSSAPPGELRGVKLISFVSTAAVLMFTASAAQAADLSATEAQKLESSLGAQGAGVYVDGGETVVNVTSEAAAEQVEAAGATAKVVEHSDAELAQVDETIKVAGNVPGMSWGTRPGHQPGRRHARPDGRRGRAGARRGRAGDAPATPPASRPPTRRSRRSSRAAKRSTPAARAARSGSTCGTPANQNFFLTAGHCTNTGSSWAGPNRALIGSPSARASPATTTASSTTSRARPRRPAMCPCTTGTRQDITTARNAIVGEAVKRSGSTTGLRSGTVQQVNADRQLRAGHRLRPDPHQRVRAAG